MNKKYKIGVDIGSTTVKLVIMDNNNKILSKAYKRHLSDSKKTIISLFKNALKKFPSDSKFSLIFTGSGAISLAKYLKIPFIQEVIDTGIKVA